MRVGPLPVSNIARVVRSNPAVRNNRTASWQLEEGIKAQGVPSGSFPWDAPPTRLGQFFPALREDLYRRSAPFVFRMGGTIPPATLFPRRSCPPHLARLRPSRGRVSRPRTTMVDHSGVSPLLPVVPARAPPPSCGALRTAPGRPSLAEPLSPRRSEGAP